VASFDGFHSEWNLGSPGGWDYQRLTQEIARVVWREINRIKPIDLELDFDHPLLYPVVGFADMLVETHRQRRSAGGDVIAVVAEQETLAEVTENFNLAERLGRYQGITGVLAAPHEFELKNGRVCHRGREVSLLFMDFNNDVLLKLHRVHDLTPLLQAVRENRVLNPRGTEPINVKSMFEVITGPGRNRFHEETVVRTPWTRRFFERSTYGPAGEKISDLVEWTRRNWSGLVLKPERGYSGVGVRVGGVHHDCEETIRLALKRGGYIVQQKIALEQWAEWIPELDTGDNRVELVQRQTDFRCLLGPGRIFGFLCRYGDVPTNVGSGGGVQPLAVLRSPITVREAVHRINSALLELDAAQWAAVEAQQNDLAIKAKFVYLLGPIKISLRPRIVTEQQLIDLKTYCRAMWADCLTLERMWLEGALDSYVDIEPEELEIARAQPWRGGPAIFASDGLFSFGAHLEES